VSVDVFADLTVEEIVTHRFEVVTFHDDGSARRHAASECDVPEVER
jgi:hypothetical protein